MLNIGTNFAPEHLEEMFDEPRLGIKRMEMRFRTWLSHASYYQFLKGQSLPWWSQSCMAADPRRILL